MLRKINLNFLEISTGKISSVDFQAGLDVKKVDYSISIQEDNIFLRAIGNGQPSPQKELRVFNLKSRSFIYSVPENVGFIFSDPDGNLGSSDLGNPSTINLLKISGNKVLERKVKVPVFGSSAISTDEKILSWHKNDSDKAGYTLLNWSLKTGSGKGIATIPGLISSDLSIEFMRVSQSQYAGNQFLVATGNRMPLDAGADRRKVIAYLPDFYKDKDTQATGKNFSGSHYGSIYVVDLTREKLRYFIPRVERVVDLAVSSDAKTMVTVENSTEGRESKLMIWDLPTGRLIRSVDTHYSRYYPDIKIFFTPDSKSLIVAAPDITFGGEKLQKSADTPDITIWNVNQLRNP